MTKYPTPTRLGVKAARLWRDTIAAYELRADELRILEDSCREADLIDRLEKELVGTPLTVRGSMGQDVAHPLLQEVSAHRVVLQRLLAALKLPESSSSQDRRSPNHQSVTARDAAIARWRR